MIFTELTIAGVFLVTPEQINDERGFFARTFCREEFAKCGLSSALEQCSLSYNKKRGTLRGMHYQADPCAEIKIVQCLKGAIYDVLLDLRPASLTFKKWISVKLEPSLHQMIYIPQGIAHGFQTLQDETEVFYQISVPYSPQHSQGIRWNDPAFGIEWPLPIEVISKRDQEYRLFS